MDRRSPSSDLPRLPHNLEAERAILGAILLDNGALDAAVEIVRPGDFLLSQHRLVFAYMIKLREEQEPIDPVILAEKLLHDGQLEDAGGVAYLSQLADGLPRSTNVGRYARIVKEKALLRGLAYAGEAITESALREDDPRQILDRIEVLSAQYKGEFRAERKLRFRTGVEIASETPAEIDWIARPWIAKGSITELAGKVKAAGKTTFVSYMARAVVDGALFLDEPTTKASVVYLTEQPSGSFRQAMERASLIGRDDFVVLFWRDTIGTPWREVVREAVEECKRRGPELLVIDTLPQFAKLQGDAENQSGDALAAMEPLQEAAANGLGVIMIRHERKGGGEVGDSGRGSSAFAGAVDVVLSLRRPEGANRKTLRLLQALSRFSETPDELVIELTKEGYVSLGSARDVAVNEAKNAILAAVPRATVDAITLSDLVKLAKIKRATAQRAIDDLLAEGRLHQTGRGKKGDPFRYYTGEIRSAQTPTSNEQDE